MSLGWPKGRTTLWKSCGFHQPSVHSGVCVTQSFLVCASRKKHLSIGPKYAKVTKVEIKSESTLDRLQFSTFDIVH